ncbi:hypothetical protein OPV22_023499 [Ensete ventricosum]|uniref:Uncharacterized protein n=1 Tax=Ensete ventricosum TaxID=4639 RepID=A0AAV8QLY5_ENSVE|nr:hypothetical protein OPV22_023499 [Ensete ventricosum]
MPRTGVTDATGTGAEGAEHKKEWGGCISGHRSRRRQMGGSPVMPVSFPRQRTYSNAATGDVISKAVPHSGRDTVAALILSSTPVNSVQRRQLTSTNGASDHATTAIGSCLPSLLNDV